jgi:thiol-disulfide isomerase/thioredoxin
MPPETLLDWVGEGKRVVLMWRPGCPSCKELIPNAISAAKQLPGVQFRTANSLTEAAFRKQYQVERVPALLLFDSGSLTDKVFGKPGTDEIIAWINNGASIKDDGPCEFCMAVRSYLPRFIVKLLERFDARNSGR